MFTEKKETAKVMLPFYNKLKKAWCKESCSPSLRENWPNGNIAKGQCFVTAMAVREEFGGKVFELKISENEIHYYNVINGEIVDLSSEQFKQHITADFYKDGVPSNIALKMCDPIKKDRYAVLIHRIKQKSSVLSDIYSDAQSSGVQCFAQVSLPLTMGEVTEHSEHGEGNQHPF